MNKYLNMILADIIWRLITDKVLHPIQVEMPNGKFETRVNCDRKQLEVWIEKEL
jgi:hypothetical protein